MNYIHLECALQVIVVWVVLQVYHDFLYESFKSINIFILYIFKYRSSILRDSLVQILILLLVKEFFLVSFGFPFSILVYYTIIDKWLELFTCLNESHPQVIALYSNLFEKLIKTSSFFAWKFLAFLVFLSLFFKVSLADVLFWRSSIR